MTVFLSCLRGLVAISFIAVSAISPASAASWLEKGIYLIGPRYDGTLPACEAGLDVIAQRFAQKEGRFWNSNLQILGLRPRTRDRLPALGPSKQFRAVTAPLLHRLAMADSTQCITRLSKMAA